MDSKTFYLTSLVWAATSRANWMGHSTYQDTGVGSLIVHLCEYHLFGY